jgi:3-deoxy-7-phosphoheptulonate synthase
MILVDVHPRPELALCDGPQALTLEEIGHYVDDVAICRRAYEERVARLRREQTKSDKAA